MIGKEIFKAGNKYSIDRLEAMINQFDQAEIIMEDNNTLKFHINGVEKVPGEYITNYTCTFTKEANGEYMVKEEKYDEVITNILLCDQSKFIKFLMTVIIVSAIFMLVKNTIHNI